MWGHIVKRFKTITATALCFVAGLGTAQAQSVDDITGPAEIPPTDYTGKEYVDSNGCIFVRAGLDGAVTWVPRVSSDRQLLCGYTPSLASAPVPTPAPLTQPAPEPAPRVVTAPPPATTTPAPTMVATNVVRTTPPPRTVTVHAPPAATRVVCTSQCGPGPYVLSDGTRVIHVPKPPAITPPPGYRMAFDPEDGRFNPYRGHVTPEGFVQMRLVWTAGVPRKLVTPETERYTVINGRPTPDREYILTHEAPHGPAYTVSTKNTPPTGHRFVEVGVFSTPDKARAAAAGLSPLGLPMNLSTARRGGTEYTVLLAGPFASTDTLSNGLSMVRGAGYTGATTRR